MKTSIFILALFLNEEVSAAQFRPYTNGRTPWYSTPKKAPEVGFPHDYFVPNFGLDHVEVVGTGASKDLAEKSTGHKWQKASFKADKGFNKDYFVPNFGIDREIQTTSKNTAVAETNLNHKWVGASFKPPKEPPMNYFVPNFGADRDMIATQEHAASQEARLGHKWLASFQKPKPAAVPQDYFVPNFGLDHDIKVSMKNTVNSESKLGAWNPDLIQAESDVHMESDPICSSAGCDQYKHKKKDRGYDIDYPVPNLGQDRDIKGHFEDLDLAEKMVGHHLIMGTKESKEKWANPAKKVDYDFAPKLDIDMRRTEGSIDQIETREGHKFEPWN